MCCFAMLQEREGTGRGADVEQRGDGAGMGRSGWPDGRLPPPVGGTTVAGTSAGALTVAAGSGKGCGRGRGNGRDTRARTGRGEVQEGETDWRDRGGRSEGTERMVGRLHLLTTAGSLDADDFAVKIIRDEWSVGRGQVAVQM
jgi:hypothetical protein